MILPFEKLPDDSKVWIYQSSRKFSDIEKNKINNRVCSEIYSGIREDECSKLIKDFFKKIRSD